MENSSSAPIRSIGIIGGGKAGLHLLDLLTGSQLAKVVYVVDRDSAAPAIVRARENRITVFTDICQAIQSQPADFIFEVTGSGKVLDLIKDNLNGSKTEVVTHDMAFVILQVIEQHNQNVRSGVREEILGIRHEIQQSLANMEPLLVKIKKVSGEMLMLAINARIEAAREGEHGKGFAVVSQKMADAVEMVSEITPEIEKATRNILAVSDKIENSLNHLE